jgi:hypothetical protein
MTRSARWILLAVLVCAGAAAAAQVWPVSWRE